MKILSAISLLFLLVISSGVYASLPDYYSEPGSNPGRVSSGSLSSEENIDPFGGGLQLQYIDHFIPGNGGLDIAVQRNYFHKNSKNTGFGVGWNITFGEIVITTSPQSLVVNVSTSGCSKTGKVSSVVNPVLILQDGTRQLLTDGNSGKPYNLISTQQWIAKCSGSNPVVYSPDGTKYEFGDSYFNAGTGNGGISSKHYLVTKITDSNNNNITINYKSYTQSINKFISSIQSSNNRRVDFYYTEKGTSKTVLLDRITSNGKTTRYQYAQKRINGQNSVGEYNLTQVTRQDNSAYTYTYYGDPVNTGDGNAYLLKTVLTPEKLRSEYKYQKIIYGLDEVDCNDHTSTDRHLNNDPNNAGCDGVDTSTNNNGSFGSNPTGGSFGSNPTGGSFGSNPTGGSFGSNPTGGSFGSNPTGGSFGSNPTGGSFGSNPTGSSTDGGSPSGSTGSLIDTIKSAVIEKRTSGGGVASGTWRYTYNPGSQSGGGDKTTVTTPIGKIEYFHYGAKYARNNRFDQAWKIGLLYEKRIYSGSSLTQTEKLQWSRKAISNQNTFDRGVSGSIDNETYMPILTKSTLTRDGSTYETSYSGHDIYGNPNSISESGSDTRSTSITYSNNTSKWIIGLATKENISSVGTIDRTFDSSGNMTSESVFGVKNTYTYSGGNISSHTDPRGKRSTFSSYYRGIPRSESHPESYSVSRSINATGTVSSETNAGRRTNYSYNNLNRLTGITYPRGSSASISWSYSSGLRGSYSRSGLQDVTNLDAAGNIKSNTLDGVTTTYRNNAAGQNTFVSLPGKSSGNTFVKDALGRIKSITRSDGKKVSYSYSGNTISVNNERGINTQYTYMTFGNPDERYVTKISSPGIVTFISRNKLGKITSVTQGGITRNYNYNSKYFLTSISNPETGTTTFTRDNSGNMLSKTVGGKRTSYTYDGQNRVKTIQYAGSPTTSFTYYSSGNVKTANKGGINWSYTYDNNDNLTQEKLIVDGRTYTTNYTYDNKDGLSNMSYPSSGPTISYSPDNLGRPTKAGSYVTSATYHPSGQLKRMTYGNGKSTTISLDSRLRTDVISTSGVMGLDYSYDGNSNITNIRDTINSQFTKSFSYDNVDRLTSAGGNTIAYNSAGNITRKNSPGKNLTYSYSSNKLRSVTNSGTTIRTFQYDGFGNVTNNGNDVFDYDGASDLVSVATQSIGYQYDAHHQRILESTENGKKYSIYNKSGKLLLEDNPSAGTKKSYIYLNSLLVAQAGTCSTSCETNDSSSDGSTTGGTTTGGSTGGTTTGGSTGGTTTGGTTTGGTTTGGTTTGGTTTGPGTSFGPGTTPDPVTTQAAPITIRPSGNVSSTTQIFTWNAVPNTTQYVLRVFDSSGGNVIYRGLNPTQANCNTDNVCTYSSSNFSVGNSYTWKVNSQNGTIATSAFSPIKSFAIQAAAITHAAPVLVSPSGIISDVTPTFTWNAVPNTTQYVLRVFDSSGGNIIYRGLNPTQANCNTDNVCTYSSSNFSVGNSYTWKVQAISGPVSSEYSPLKNFTVEVANVTGLPSISLPESGSTLSGSTQVFIWTSNGTAADQYWLEIGPTVGSSDYFGKNYGLATTSEPVTGLPTDGSTVYVRLYYNTSYDFVDFEYTASNSSNSVTTLETPLSVGPVGKISNTTPNFTWNSVDNSLQYMLRIYDSTGVSISSTGYSPSQVSCANGGVCNYSGMTLGEGSYSWEVQAIAGGVNSEFSLVKSFTIESVNSNVTGLPTISLPQSGSTLSGSTQVFTWSANGTTADQYWLEIGPTVGSSDYFGKNYGLATTSEPVTGLPTDGSTVYVRLYYNTSYAFVDFEYTASNASTPVTTLDVPTLVGPTGTINATTPTFTWNAVADSTEYRFRLFDSAGVSISFQSMSPTQASCDTGGVCSYSGTTVSEGSYTWKVQAISGSVFSEYSPIKNFAVEVTNVTGLPTINSPSIGSTLSGSTQTFTWSANGTTADQYWLEIGPTVGSSDYFGKNYGLATTSDPVTGLPTDGSTIYVRLYYNTNYDHVDFEYTASGNTNSNTGNTLPILIKPEGSISDTSPQFTWTAVDNASRYSIRVRDSNGASVIGVIVYNTNCDSDTGICTYTGSGLTAGTYTWSISSQVDSTSTTSAPKSFTVTP